MTFIHDIEAVVKVTPKEKLAFFGISSDHGEQGLMVSKVVGALRTWSFLDLT